MNTRKFRLQEIETDPKGDASAQLLSNTSSLLNKGALMQTADSAHLIGASVQEAIFHLSAKTMSRGKGDCVLSRVAYRTGCRMYGANGKVVADYTLRRGVLHSEIVAPKLCPPWVRTRNELWIEVARAEKRRNSVEAREFEVAIPVGITQSDAIKLAAIFANALVEKHRVVVDFSLHADSRKNWQGTDKNFAGFHVHFLMSTRRIYEGGFGEKTRELDVKHTGMVRYWRERWEQIANEFMHGLGINARIDHRSNKDQQKSRPTLKHLGPKITGRERGRNTCSVGKEVGTIVIDNASTLAARDDAKRIDLVSTIQQALADRKFVKRHENCR